MASRSRRLAGLVTATLAGATLAAVPPAAQAAGPDYIEVAGTCTLARAITIANLGAAARPTAECPSLADGATTIRITTNSGTAVNPLTGVTSPGVQLSRDTTAAGDPALGGTSTILPAIVGNVTIEGDPTGLQPANGYSIYADGSPSSVTGLPSLGHRLFAVVGGGSLTVRNLTIGGGVAAPQSGATGGYGGAIYAQGALTLDHVALIGNHAGGGDGSVGTGGAVYATSGLTVTSSVFEANTATGGSGADGGSALGGAIGLGDQGVARISDSIFTANSAFGGSGAAGVNGADGRDGRNGGRGNCVGTDVVSYAIEDIEVPPENGGDLFAGLVLAGIPAEDAQSGGDGEGGRNGADGTSGGDGGDAVGAIAGGASVTVDHSAFVDNDAVAGAAGVEGFGGIGGDGGDGGNGVVCGSSRGPGASVIYASSYGNGGAAGNGGDNGISGAPGARGAAIATVSSGTVTLVDVTTVGGSTRIPDDNYGPLGETAWKALRAQRVNPGAGSPGLRGKAVPGSGGVDGATGVAGDRDLLVIDRERTAGLGRASVIETTTSTTTSTRISFSTFADVAPRVPAPSTSGPAGHPGPRANQATPILFSASRGQIKGSLLWNPALGGGGCAALASAGWNVFGTGCHGEAGTAADRARDRITTTRPVVGDSTGAGEQIRPPHSGGAGYRMPVLPLEAGSVALDTAPTGVGTLNGPCQVLGAGANEYLGDDARRSPRPGDLRAVPDTACDSGAYEDDGSDPYVMLTGDYRAFVGKPGEMTAVVARNPGAGTSLRVRVEGIDGVDFPDGFDATPGDAAPDVSEATVKLAGNVAYPYAPSFELDPTHTGLASVTATILGATGGTTTATTWVSLVNDGQVAVTAEAPPAWSSCQGYLPITYTARSVGHSPAPASTVRVWPNAVYPDNGNGLTTPPGEESSPVVKVAYASGVSTVAVSAFDDSVIWSIPALDAGASVTLKTYVYVGRIVNSLDGYPVGSQPIVGSSVVYPPGSTNTPLQPVNRILGSVQVRSDIATLNGTLAGAEADPSVDPVLKSNQSGTFYGTLDPGACAAPTDKHDWGYVHVTVKDHATGEVLAEYDTQNLKVDDNADPALDGNPWFPIPVTAPTEPGVYNLDFIYNSTPTNQVTADSLVLEMPYRVHPVGVYVEGDTEAPESTEFRKFTVKLDRALPEAVTLDWEVVSGTAQVGEDLAEQSGRVRISAGFTQASIALTVDDDTVPEQDEYFVVRLSERAETPLPDGVALTSATAMAYIEDDDGTVATTLAPSPATTIAAGESVTPSVTMSAGEGPMLGMPVTLQESANGTTGWTDVGSYLTKLEGVATGAALTPTATTYYRWVYGGTDRFAASTSAVTKVTVLIGTSLSSNADRTIVAGRSTTLSTILTAGSSGVAGQAVTLQQSPAGATDWTDVKRLTTSASGSASHVVKPSTNSTYRWVFAPTSTYAASTSATTTVTVSQAVSVKASATRIRHGKSAKITLFGTVTPAATGQKVITQVLKHGVWVNTPFTATIRRQVLPAGGKKVGYVVKVPARTKGTFKYRIYRAATASNAAGHSRVVVVRVL